VPNRFIGQWRGRQQTPRASMPRALEQCDIIAQFAVIGLALDRAIDQPNLQSILSTRGSGCASSRAIARMPAHDQLRATTDESDRATEPKPTSTIRARSRRCERT